MTKKTKWKGYTTDLTLGWIVQDLGPEWLQWQQYAAEWLATQNSNVHTRMESIKHFLLYLKNKAPYAHDVASMFKGHPGGHQVSTEEFVDHLAAVGRKAGQDEINNFIKAMCDHILNHHLSYEDDDGNPVALFRNPFENIRAPMSNTETVHSALPYRYIQQRRTGQALRLIEAKQLPIEEIARRCGFASLRSMRAQIRRHAGARTMS